MCVNHPIVAAIYQEVWSWNFRAAFTTALLSGALGAVLFHGDRDLDWNILQDYLPDIIVYNGFIVFASFAASFRTTHALRRYVDAASFVQKLRASWVDAATTLITFCRLAKPQALDQVEDFQHKVVRMLSLLNAMCLEVLANNAKKNRQGSCCYRPGVSFFDFPVLGPDDFTPEFKRALESAKCKPEFLLQMLEALVMQANASGIIPVEPPLLTIPLGELSKGYEIYNEAKKLAEVPFPWSYTFFTFTVLAINAIFTPCMLAASCKGINSTFICTFGGCFLIWFVNAVADSLNNPYQKGARLMHAGEMQMELNRILAQLMGRSKQLAPKITLDEAEPILHKYHTNERISLRTFQTQLSEKRAMSVASRISSRARRASQSRTDSRPVSEGRSASQSRPSIPSQGDASRLSQGYSSAREGS